MTVQEAVEFVLQQKEDSGAACSGLRKSPECFLGAGVELFPYRYTAGDGLPTP
jgi:hypothetical protein